MAVAAATQAPQDFVHTPGAPGHKDASEADCDVSAILDWRMMHWVACPVTKRMCFTLSDWLTSSCCSRSQARTLWL